MAEDAKTVEEILKEDSATIKKVMNSTVDDCDDCDDVDIDEEDDEQLGGDDDACDESENDSDDHNHDENVLDGWEDKVKFGDKK